MNMNHLAEMIKNRDDKRRMIRAVQEKEEHFMLVCQILGSHRERPSDNSEEEKHAQTMKQKKIRVTDTSRPTDAGESPCL